MSGDGVGGLVDTITQVLEQHDWDVYADEDGTGGVLCPCGWRVHEGTGRDVHAHLAAALVQALGLKQEMRTYLRYRDADCDGQARCGYGIQTRLTSPWVVVGGTQ